MVLEEHRPTPEEILKKIRMIDPDETRVRQGRLKIFFGYAAGVGKTYAMLEMAHQMKDMGVDVVAGYIEPHIRPATMKLVEGLECLPPLVVSYKGITLREFDLDAALARKPQLILVDELAHSNAQGCRHVKRYQDIEELLRAGIDVYTTVNVQHLESLNDLVSSLTGVTVNERIPDWVFDSADQVEVVDVEPDDLIARLEEGKVYRAAQAQQALGHFFSKQNLAALREIALRRTADRLNRTARKQHPEGFLNPSDHILVCLSSAPSNAKVIRTAARMAEAFQGDFTALFVETPDTRELSGENRKRLRANLKLAEDLGARIATVYGDDPATQIADYSRTSGVTKIVLGRTNHRRRRGWWNKKALVDRLTELAPNLDVYIIPDRQPAYRPKWKIAPSELSFSWKDTGKMLGILAAATLLGELFSRLGFGETNIVTVYILGVLLTATWTEGRLYGILSSLLSVLTFNFFFTEPYFSLDAHPSYVITFFIMFLSSFLTSSLTIRIKTQARMAVQKSYSTEVLLEATQLLQQASGEHEVLAIAVSQLGKLLDRPILYYPMDPDGQLMQARIYPETESNLLSRYTGGQEKAVADWVCKNNKHAGAGTHTLPNPRCLYLAVRSHGGPQAVVGIPCDDYPLPEAFEQNLIRGILNQAGIVLEQRLSDLRRADTPFQGDSL